MTAVNHAAAEFGNRGAGSRIKDYSDERLAQLNREQRLRTVRAYLKLRAKYGTPLLAKGAK